MTVNRTLPAVEPPKAAIQFSPVPTVEEISLARVFEEPLVPVGGVPTAVENAALAAALLGYAQRVGPDDFSSLTSFLDQHPDSPWRAALLTNLGLEYYNTARYSLSIPAWSEAWRLAKNAADPAGKAIADRAAGELAYMFARLGRMQELEALLRSLEGRVVVGPATERIAGASQGLANMQERPEIAFRCGPLALHRILHALGVPKPRSEVIYASASTREGFSLAQVAELSRQVDLNLQMAFRDQNARVVLPAVVHWKVGHYAALIREEAGRFLVQDPTFRNDVWITRDALGSEASGYFLVPPGELGRGWRKVKADEASRIWGKGQTGGNDPDPSGPCDPKKSEASCGGGGGGGCGGGGGGGGGPDGPGPDPGGPEGPDGPGPDDPDGPSPDGGPLGPVGPAGGFGPTGGMAVASAHLMLVSLNIVDEPLAYTPPFGPSVRCVVTYNQREANQPTMFTYSNFGAKWTFNWLAYIKDNPSSPSADVQYYQQGGGTRRFKGFDSATQTFAFQQYDQTKMVRTSPTSYELQSADGWKRVFSQSDGSTGTSRKIFLKKIIDPSGNAVELTYDNSFRIVALKDALGQVTTLAYTHPSDIYKITKVTDPFGRFATFDYDASARLIRITDAIGLTSEFTYESAGDFITSLITGYGTTSFTRGQSGTTRWLETTYPDGGKDRVEYNQGTNLGIPDADPVSTVPAGMRTLNQFLWFRNTYYWSRVAYATGAGDYTKAKVYHWQHAEDPSVTSGILESVKEPLEGRVWLDYAGQDSSLVGPAFPGSTNKPAHVGRVLDDGSTQLRSYEYNDFGKVTRMIDPVGRTFSYGYAANGVDLIETRMTRDGADELLSQTTYNAQHLPLATTDSGGQSTINTYNVRGQLRTTKNAKNEVTTYNYSPDGYLISVDGPLPGAGDVETYTYDTFGRVRTRTDASGYSLTFDYDALNRLTKTTYPDGTYTQATYSRLDAVESRDRAGQITTFEFDQIRQMRKRTDALNRVTLFQWCRCGESKSLTDPMGRTTSWEHDVQGRPTKKVYPDGSAVSYFYENRTGQLALRMTRKARRRTTPTRAMGRSAASTTPTRLSLRRHSPLPTIETTPDLPR